MNERVKALMLEAGYAAPELAGRANKLAELIVLDCAKVIEGQDIDPGFKLRISWAFKKKFGVEV
jgi:hypothetical protein